MDEQEIKEYLDKIDQLGQKLEGEDFDTFSFVIYGYNACAKLLSNAEQKREELEQWLSSENKIDVINKLKELDEKYENS